MLSEEQLLAGAGLDRWFSDFVASLVGTIRQASQPGGSAKIAPQNARAFLTQIRENAEENTAGLDEAFADALHAIGDLESLSGNLLASATDEDHGRKVQAARVAALETVARLAEVLKQAKPSSRSRALYPQPHEADYRPPQPV